MTLADENTDFLALVTMTSGIRRRKRRVALGMVIIWWMQGRLR